MILFIKFHKSTLRLAIERENFELVELLMNNKKIVINEKDKIAFFI